MPERPALCAVAADYCASAKRIGCDCDYCNRTGMIASRRVLACSARYVRSAQGSGTSMRRLPPLTAIEAFVQVARLGSIKAAAAGTRAVAAGAQPPRPGARALHRQAAVRAAAPGDGAQRRWRAAARADRAGARPAVRRGRGDDQRHRSAAAAARRPAAVRVAAAVPAAAASCARRIPSCISISIPAAHGVARLGDGLDAVIALAREIDPGALCASGSTATQVYVIGARSLVEGPDPVTRPEQLAGADRAGPPRHARHVQRVARTRRGSTSSSRWRSIISIRAR